MHNGIHEVIRYFQLTALLEYGSFHATLQADRTKGPRKSLARANEIDASRCRLTNTQHADRLIKHVTLDYDDMRDVQRLVAYRRQAFHQRYHLKAVNDRT